MRFLVTWQVHGSSEADAARILALFAKWKPPVELRDWSGFADGSGGMAIVDTDDVEVLSAVSAPWSPWLSFTMRPLAPIERTAAVLAEARAFRASVAP